MPGIEISALPPAPLAKLTDVFPIDQVPGPVTYKLEVSQLLTLFENNLVASITGTANQVLVDGTSGTPQTGAVILTLPQNIATTSTPTFGGLTLTNTSANQILYSTSLNQVQGITSANSATLVTNSTGVPSLTSSLTNGQVLIGSTGATPTPATITAGTNISITNGAASITVAATGLAGFTWTVVTGTSQNMSPDNGYIPNNAGLVTLNLPTTSAVGTQIGVVGKGAGGWRIQCGVGQTIVLGSSTTTSGGTLSSTNAKDSLTMICTVANTEWTIYSAPQGNITVA